MAYIFAIPEAFLLLVLLPGHLLSPLLEHCDSCVAACFLFDRSRNCENSMQTSSDAKIFFISPRPRPYFNFEIKKRPNDLRNFIIHAEVILPPAVDTPHPALLAELWHSNEVPSPAIKSGASALS